MSGRPNDPAALFELGTALGLQASWAATIEGTRAGRLRLGAPRLQRARAGAGAGARAQGRRADRRHLPLPGRQPDACRRAGSPTWPASAATRRRACGSSQEAAALSRAAPPTPSSRWCCSQPRGAATPGGRLRPRTAARRIRVTACCGSKRGRRFLRAGRPPRPRRCSPTECRCCARTPGRACWAKRGSGSSSAGSARPPAAGGRRHRRSHRGARPSRRRRGSGTHLPRAGQGRRPRRQRARAQAQYDRCLQLCAAANDSDAAAEARRLRAQGYKVTDPDAMADEALDVDRARPVRRSPRVGCLGLVGARRLLLRQHFDVREAKPAEVERRVRLAARSLQGSEAAPRGETRQRFNARRSRRSPTATTARCRRRSACSPGKRANPSVPASASRSGC